MSWSDLESIMKALLVVHFMQLFWRNIPNTCSWVEVLLLHVSRPTLAENLSLNAIFCPKQCPALAIKVQSNIKLCWIFFTEFYSLKLYTFQAYMTIYVDYIREHVSESWSFHIITWFWAVATFCSIAGGAPEVLMKMAWIFDKKVFWSANKHVI